MDLYALIYKSNSYSEFSVRFLNEIAYWS